MLRVTSRLPRVAGTIARLIRPFSVATATAADVSSNGLHSNQSVSQAARATTLATKPPVAACPYPGAPHVAFSTENVTRQFRVTTPPYPIYRVMDEQGKIVAKDYTLKLDHATLKKMYTTMCLAQTIDSVFLEAQRQGRITFHMQTTGEEAACVGSAAGLRFEDLIYGQYRESGSMLWRGYSLPEMADQLFSNTLDLNKGRQMPMHFGKKSLNIHTISSPLATQIPQAAGAAYALARRENNQSCVLCYFGDGAASEGDFHAGLNFAATLRCPVLFFCRNNGYAISTPTKEQYAGDGIVARGPAYGIPSIRVDGNDLLAVWEATSAARQLALSGKLGGERVSVGGREVGDTTPVLIEAMTYRGGHHSTSDDSSRYRDASEIQYWLEHNHPIIRMRRFLQETLKIWDDEQENAMRTKLKADVMAELSRAEKLKRPPISELFKDVYDTMPPLHKEQHAQLLEHLREYGQHYDLPSFEAEEKYIDPAVSSGAVPPNANQS